MVLGDKINELNPQKESKGYLICSKCKGYYELQENESPMDFEGCECGGGLKFSKNLPKPVNKEFNPSNTDITGNIPHDLDEYEELQEIVTILKNKAHVRKKLLENLSNRISVQEEILNELKGEKWDLWDHLEEKELQDGIEGQKTLLENIVEQEDNLLSHIKDHRVKAESVGNNSNIGSLTKIGALIVFLIIGILVIFLIS